MYKKVFIFISICAVLLISYVLWQKQAITTITYFPIDKSKSFERANTSVKAFQTSTQDNYMITWNVQSKSEGPLYLRQDISLLYENGTFIGALSKWQENTDTIEAHETFKRKNKHVYQAISFHHGEVHDEQDGIKSIQTMTADRLYVVQQDHELFVRFHQPKSVEEKRWQQTLDQLTKEHLMENWTSLIDHYKLKKDDYYLIPLTNLYQYNDRPLPSLTMDKTEQVIGQLWEGIYKNYLIPATRHQKQKKPHSIPIILFDKQTTHLLVLFELNGKKHRLIQNIS